MTNVLLAAGSLRLDAGRTIVRPLVGYSSDSGSRVLIQYPELLYQARYPSCGQVSWFSDPAVAMVVSGDLLAMCLRLVHACQLPETAHRRTPRSRRTDPSAKASEGELFAAQSAE